MVSTPERLNILWLSHFVPYPPKGGCFQRSYNLITRTGARHDLHLIALRHKSSTHPPEEVRNAETELLRHCRSVHIVDISKSTETAQLPLLGLRSLLTLTPFNVLVYRSQEVRDLIARLRRDIRFDVAHFDTIGLAQYLPDVGDTPKVMTHHGAESHMIRRRIARERDPLKRAFFYFEWQTLRRYERRMCPRFAENIVMSADDGRLMAEVAPDAVYTPVDNGVDTKVFTPVPLHGRRTLVFAGRLDQYSNRDGMIYFAEQVWPRVKARYPDAIMHVIGNNPPDALRRLAAADASFKLHGFVPDVRPYFQDASVAICPLRDGGGTRIKVLDALAQGIPLVATTVGCEGIDVVPERHVLIGDTPEEFARQIARVFDDAALRSRLASESRRLAEERYSWDSLAGKLLAVYDRVAAGAVYSRS